MQKVITVWYQTIVVSKDFEQEYKSTYCVVVYKDSYHNPNHRASPIQT